MLTSKVMRKIPKSTNLEMIFKLLCFQFYLHTTVLQEALYKFHLVDLVSSGAV